MPEEKDEPKAEARRAKRREADRARKARKKASPKKDEKDQSERSRHPETSHAPLAHDPTGRSPQEKIRRAKEADPDEPDFGPPDPADMLPVAEPERVPEVIHARAEFLAARGETPSDEANRIALDERERRLDRFREDSKGADKAHDVAAKQVLKDRPDLEPFRGLPSLYIRAMVATVNEPVVASRRQVDEALRDEGLSVDQRVELNNLVQRNVIYVEDR